MGLIDGILTSIPWLQLLGLLGLILTTWYWYMTRNHGKYEKYGFHTVPTSLAFGNQAEMMKQELNQMDYFKKVYDDHKGHR